MIDELLKKLGFTDKEIQVYLAVLENGKIAPAAIASLTNIKRPTVYSVGKELIKRGVMAEDMHGPNGYFVALPLEHLEKALQVEERALSEKRKIARELITKLESVPKSKSYSVPKMRFIEEHNITDFLYSQTPVWEASMSAAKDMTWWGFQDHTMVEKKEHLEWIEWYWKRAPQQFDVKIISNDSSIERSMQTRNLERRQIKFWKEDFRFTATTWALGEYVVFMMTKQHPYYLVEIHDAVYAENMRELFRNLWGTIDTEKK